MVSKFKFIDDDKKKKNFVENLLNDFELEKYGYWIINYDLLDFFIYDYYDIFQVVPSEWFTFSHHTERGKFGGFFFNYKAVTKKELKNFIMYLGYSFDMFGNETFLLKFGVFISQMRVEYYLFFLLKYIKLDELYFLFINDKFTIKDAIIFSKVINIGLTYYFNRRVRYGTDDEQKISNFNYVRLLLDFATDNFCGEKAIVLKRDWLLYQNVLLKNVNVCNIAKFFKFYRLIYLDFFKFLFCYLRCYNKFKYSLNHKYLLRGFRLLLRRIFFKFFNNFLKMFSLAQIDYFMWNFFIFFFNFFKKNLIICLQFFIKKNFLYVFFQKKFIKFLSSFVLKCKFFVLNFFKFYIRFYENRKNYMSLNNFDLRSSIVLKKYVYENWNFLFNGGLSNIDNFNVFLTFQPFSGVLFDGRLRTFNNLLFRLRHAFLVDFLQTKFYSFNFKKYIYFMYRANFLFYLENFDFLKKFNFFSKRTVVSLIEQNSNHFIFYNVIKFFKYNIFYYYENFYRLSIVPFYFQTYKNILIKKFYYAPLAVRVGSSIEDFFELVTDDLVVDNLDLFLEDDRFLFDEYLDDDETVTDMGMRDNWFEESILENAEEDFFDMYTIVDDFLSLQNYSDELYDKKYKGFRLLSMENIDRFYYDGNYFRMLYEFEKNAMVQMREINAVTIVNAKPYKNIYLLKKLFKWAGRYSKYLTYIKYKVKNHSYFLEKHAYLFNANFYSKVQAYYHLLRVHFGRKPLSFRLTRRLSRAVGFRVKDIRIFERQLLAINEKIIASERKKIRIELSDEEQRIWENRSKFIKIRDAYVAPDYAEYINEQRYKEFNRLKITTLADYYKESRKFEFFFFDFIVNKMYLIDSIFDFFFYSFVVPIFIMPSESAKFTDYLDTLGEEYQVREASFDLGNEPADFVRRFEGSGKIRYFYDVYFYRNLIDYNEIGFPRHKHIGALMDVKLMALNGLMINSGLNENLFEDVFDPFALLSGTLETNEDVFNLYETGSDKLFDNSVVIYDKYELAPNEDISAALDNELVDYVFDNHELVEELVVGDLLPIYNLIFNNNVKLDNTLNRFLVFGNYFLGENFFDYLVRVKAVNSFFSYFENVQFTYFEYSGVFSRKNCYRFSDFYGNEFFERTFVFNQIKKNSNSVLKVSENNLNLFYKFCRIFGLDIFYNDNELKKCNYSFLNCGTFFLKKLLYLLMDNLYKKCCLFDKKLFIFFFKIFFNLFFYFFCKHLLSVIGISIKLNNNFFEKSNFENLFSIFINFDNDNLVYFFEKFLVDIKLLMKFLFNLCSYSINSEYLFYKKYGNLLFFCLKKKAFKFFRYFFFLLNKHFNNGSNSYNNNFDFYSIYNRGFFFKNVFNLVKSPTLRSYVSLLVLYFTDEDNFFSQLEPSAFLSWLLNGIEFNSYKDITFSNYTKILEQLIKLKNVLILEKNLYSKISFEAFLTKNNSFGRVNQDYAIGLDNIFSEFTDLLVDEDFSFDMRDDSFEVFVGDGGISSSDAAYDYEWFDLTGDNDYAEPSVDSESDEGDADYNFELNYEIVTDDNDSFIDDFFEDKHYAVRYYLHNYRLFFFFKNAYDSVLFFWRSFFINYIKYVNRYKVGLSDGYVFADKNFYGRKRKSKKYNNIFPFTDNLGFLGFFFNAKYSNINKVIIKRVYDDYFLDNVDYFIQPIVSLEEFGGVPSDRGDIINNFAYSQFSKKNEYCFERILFNFNYIEIKRARNRLLILNSFFYEFKGESKFIFNPHLLWIEKEDLMIRKLLSFYDSSFFFSRENLVFFLKKFQFSVNFFNFLLLKVRKYIVNSIKSRFKFIKIYNKCVDFKSKIIFVKEYLFSNYDLIVEDYVLDLFIHFLGFFKIFDRFVNFTIYELIFFIKKIFVLKFFFKNQLSFFGYFVLLMELKWFKNMFPTISKKEFWLKLISLKDTIKIEEFYIYKNGYKLVNIISKYGFSEGLFFIESSLKYDFLQKKLESKKEIFFNNYYFFDFLIFFVFFICGILLLSDNTFFLDLFGFNLNWYGWYGDEDLEDDEDEVEAKMVFSIFGGHSTRGLMLDFYNRFITLL